MEQYEKLNREFKPEYKEAIEKLRTEAIESQVKEANSRLLEIEKLRVQAIENNLVLDQSIDKLQKQLEVIINSKDINVITDMVMQITKENT